MASEPRPIDEIYWRALAIESATERAEYLTDACQGDDSLHATLKEMLSLNQKADEFWKPFEDGTGPYNEDDEFEQPGTIISNYELGEMLGEGGLGIVYRADQEDPVNRTVALKIIKRGMDSRQVTRRFEAEKQILAAMNHPGICQFYDAGITEDGRPYFAMELVDGARVTDFCDSQGLGIEDRLKLFITICRAVEYAHQKAVIHRDLKPSNILVETSDTPCAKIIDFGIAKCLDSSIANASLVTRHTVALGTPFYMSPEQASMLKDVDTRSDIYSLGVVLYELLTRTKLLDPSRIRDLSLDEVYRIVKEEEHPRPSQSMNAMSAAGSELPTARSKNASSDRRMLQRMRSELDWIVMKAIEKDRDRRYQTVAELTADLSAFLNYEPVTARPPSVWYRLSRFTHRHWAALSVTVAVFVIVILAALYGWNQAEIADKARGLAERRLTLAQEASGLAEDRLLMVQEAREQTANRLYVADMKLVSDAIGLGQIARARALLDRNVPKPREPDRRRFEWYFQNDRLRVEPLWRVALPSRIRRIRRSPDGTVLAVAQDIGGTAIVDSSGGTTVMVLPSGTAVNGLDWSSDGKTIVTGHASGSVRIWSVSKDEEDCKHELLTEFAVGPDRLSDIVFVDDERNVIISAEDGKVELWDVEDGALIKVLHSHEGPVEQIAVTADRAFLASAGNDNILRFSSLDAPEVTIREIRCSIPSALTSRMVATAFSGNKQFLAGGDIAGNVVVFNPSDKQQSDVRVDDGVECLGFLTNPTRLVVGDRGGIAHVWQIHMRGAGQSIELERTQTWSTGNSRLEALDTNPSDNQIFSGSRDGVLSAWPGAKSSSRRDLAIGSDCAFLSNDQAVVCTDHLSLIDIEAHSVTTAVPSRSGDQWDFITLNADADRIVVWNNDELAVFDWRSRLEWRFESKEKSFHRVAISPDGNWLAVGHFPKEAIDYVELIELGVNSTAKRLFVRDFSAVAFAPNGEFLAVGSSDDLLLYDLDGNLRTRCVGHDSTISGIAIHPTDPTITTVSHDRTLKVWDSRNGKLLSSIRAHSHKITTVSFGEGGRTLVTAAYDGKVCFWDYKTLQPLLDIDLWAKDRVCLSPNGERLLACDAETVSLLAAHRQSPAKPVSERPAADIVFIGTSTEYEDITPRSISDDGRVVAGDMKVAGRRRSFQWSRSTGTRILDLKNPDQESWSTRISPDGERVTAALSYSGGTFKIPWYSEIAVCPKDGHFEEVKYLMDRLGFVIPRWYSTRRASDDVYGMDPLFDRDYVFINARHSNLTIESWKKLRACEGVDFIWPNSLEGLTYSAPLQRREISDQGLTELVEWNVQSQVPQVVGDTIGWQYTFTDCESSPLLVGFGVPNTGASICPWSYSDGVFRELQSSTNMEHSAAQCANRRGDVIFGVEWCGGRNVCSEATTEVGVLQWSNGELRSIPIHSQSFQFLPRLVSDSGQVISGYAWPKKTHGDNCRLPFRYESGKLHWLGSLPGWEEFATPKAMSSDGEVIVGQSRSAFGERAFIWTQKEGLRDLNRVALSEGYQRFTRLLSAEAISPDGRFVLGKAIDQAGRIRGYRVDLTTANNGVD